MENALENSEIQDRMEGWLLDKAVGPGATLRQGDLIVFEKADSPVHKVGIVVTADCDLEKKKHARLVTLVPVINTKTVLERCLFIEELEHKREQIEAYLFKEYSINQDQDRATSITLLRCAYESSDQKRKDDLKRAADFVLGDTEVIPIDSYTDLMKKIGGHPKGRNAFRDKIRDRGDLLILPSIKKLGVDANIAWLRPIWQVYIDEIALRTSEVADRSGERLGRLDSPYRYRLTQLMAQVFADIGLPNVPDDMDEAIKEVYDNV